SPLIPKLIEFRRVVGSAPLTHFWTDDHSVAFARDKIGFLFVAISDSRQSSRVHTSMRPGVYCDIVSGHRVGNDCTGDPVVVELDGTTTVGVREDSAHPVIAILSE
ncbi:hypothetical protein V5799_022783, partial [Amblyomma americanum]